MYSTPSSRVFGPPAFTARTKEPEIEPELEEELEDELEEELEEELLLELDELLLDELDEGLFEFPPAQPNMVAQSVTVATPTLK